MNVIQAAGDRLALGQHVDTILLPQVFFPWASLSPKIIIRWKLRVTTGLCHVIALRIFIASENRSEVR